ncbi:MAG: ATP-binding protein [Dehalococcoidia bacterium]|nr:MAG: ATP-binding protein [Dehalococcoidia bacterium]
MGETAADVRILKESLKDIPEPVANPVFILVCGLPGAGKSYFSRKLVEKLPGTIVESDAMRRSLWQSPTHSAQESHRLFSALYVLIEDLLRGGITVVHDATNLLEQNRERLYKICERLRVKIIIVWVQAPRETILERMQGRAMGVDPMDSSEADWSVYERMKTRVERIRRSYFAVDTSHDIGPVINKIVREAKR